MKPEHVTPRNFELKEVLFNNTDFSVAYGYWEDTDWRVGLRWNGDGVDVGYPKVFGNPMWFILEPALAVSFVAGLLGQPGADKDKILQALQVL
ncbi:MAG: hypothetical protein EOO63_06755 [Hymenobacter sp.]|nr:MAG: hypothetical protein EOO63_06755 [Hymenobacter sp.]